MIILYNLSFLRLSQLVNILVTGYLYSLSQNWPFACLLHYLSRTYINSVKNQQHAVTYLNISQLKAILNKNNATRNEGD